MEGSGESPKSADMSDGPQVQKFRVSRKVEHQPPIIRCCTPRPDILSPTQHELGISQEDLPRTEPGFKIVVCGESLVEGRQDIDLDEPSRSGR